VTKEAHLLADHSLQCILYMGNYIRYIKITGKAVKITKFIC